MTEERKGILLERFLAEELTEPEKTEFRDAMEGDSDFEAHVNFSLQMSAAMQEDRIGELRTQRKQERKKSRLLKVLITGVVVILLAFVAFQWAKNRKPVPFTPEEGLELMNNVIATATNEGEVAVVAGDNWRNDLVAGAQVQGKYEEALTTLIAELDQRGYCQDYQLDFYAGTLELYISRSPERATPLLECLEDKSIKRYADQLKLPLILLRLAQGRDAEAADLFNKSGMPYTVLPEKARDRISEVNQ
jgi:hypothetical protein